MITALITTSMGLEREREIIIYYYYYFHIYNNNNKRHCELIDEKSGKKSGGPGRHSI